MRPSHLFGTLEAPGQKAYPSKDFDYYNLNPKQPGQVTQVTIQKKLSNGLVWAHPGKDLPLTTMDTYPKLDPSKTWRKLSQGTGSFGSEFKASNPETITSFGIMPTYPEEEAMRMALNARPRIMAMEVGAREEYPKAPAPEFKVGAGRIGTKFSPEKIQQLVDMGIPEELIGKTIEEELKKDLMSYLNNPALLAEVQTTEAIQNIYEKFVANRVMKTGENAPGGAPGSGSQNIGVRAYSAPAMISMLSPKAQRLAELRASEFGPTSLLPRDYPASPADMREVSSRKLPNLLEMGAGPGGGGLSISAFGMLAGTRVAAQAKAEAQEAEEEERYESGHSRREMEEGAVAAAAAAPASMADRLFGEKGKGGRKPKSYMDQLDTLSNQVATGKAQQTISGTVKSLRTKGAPSEEIEAAIAKGKAMRGGGGGFM
jgi:hypothetical protein